MSNLSSNFYSCEAKPKRLEDLSEKQQRACYAFAKMWSLDAHEVAPHLDLFFQLADRRITVQQVERITGMTLFDTTHPSLFEEPTSSHEVTRQ